MLYTVMISAIVGVADMIPFCGPLIGAIPSAGIIFTESPIKSLHFVTCITMAQQIARQRG